MSDTTGWRKLQVGPRWYVEGEDGQTWAQVADERRADRILAALSSQEQRVNADGLAQGEWLGRLVRATWIQWAMEQPNPKPSWLQTWDELTPAERDVDRRIGLAVANAQTTGLEAQVQQLQAERDKAIDQRDQYERAWYEYKNTAFSELRTANTALRQALEKAGAEALRRTDDNSTVCLRCGMETFHEKDGEVRHEPDCVQQAAAADLAATSPAEVRDE